MSCPNCGGNRCRCAARVNKEIAAMTTDKQAVARLRAELERSTGGQYKSRCTLVQTADLAAVLAALSQQPVGVEELRETLEGIANWRRDSATYTDNMNLPRRKMDLSQIIHMEGEAKRALTMLERITRG